MPIFKYKAIDSTGNVIESIQNAASKEQMAEILRSRSNMPVYIEEYREKANKAGLFSRKVKIKEIAIFCRQFYTMLHTGIPIINCLDTLRIQTEDKKLRESVNTLYEDVQTGVSFAESMRKLADIFPDLLINMIEAGELSGTLDSVMHRMAVHYDKETKLNAKVKNAMIYPIILLIALVGVMVGMLVWILPMFTSMFADSGVALPLPTQILIALSDSLMNYWYIYILSIAVIVIAFYRFSQTDSGALFIDSTKLKLPIFGKALYKIATARFTRTLSTLMFSGMSLMQSLEITAKVIGNRQIKGKLDTAKEQVMRGIDLSTAIRETQSFPLMLTSMIMVGEESGTLDDILEKTADLYDAEVEAATQAMVAVFEPVVIVFMAIFIAITLISIYLPMFDMMQTVQ